MPSLRLEKPASAQVACVGAGLVTLDIVVDRESPEQYLVRSGGSCGNVVTILAYLGWETYPIAKIGRDKAAEIVLKDLSSFGVNTTFIAQEEEASTPTIIEGVRRASRGNRTHAYTLYCPRCGNNLPRYRAIPQALAGRVVKERAQAQVFYFDRLSKGILDLARHYREQDALIVFEPSAIKDQGLFNRAVSLSHILKYSHERLSDVSGVLGDYAVPLEIQTLGAEGLRYRRTTGKDQGASWQCMPAYRVSDVVDEAGAGDWCTSGIIHSLGRHGVKSFWRTRSSGIERALELGQALAAANCRFKSARGAMYSLSLQELDAVVLELARGQPLGSAREMDVQGTLSELLQSVCARCSRGA